MFTDTKNLANLTANTTNAAVKQQNNHILNNSEEKFKLKKMWKPILRLMSRKSSLTRNGAKRDHNSSIPNNVHLNNATQYPTVNTNKDLLTTPPYQQDTTYLTHKLPLAEFWQTQQSSEQTYMPCKTSEEPLEFISKASIDKTPLDTCSNCVYGRNCQHTQFHTTFNVNCLQPLHYFDAEDGCFVWSDGNGSDVDEIALREWFWQNSWQFAENATIC